MFFELKTPHVVSYYFVAMEVKVDDLSGSEIVKLLLSHLEDLKGKSPPESMHALGLDALKKPGITMWSVWEGEELMGCGALKELDAEHAEVKSMRTAAAHLRKAVASRLLEHMIEEARRRKYRRLSLETGAGILFEPAQRLYAKFGFRNCGPFGEYVEDPNSVFMTREM
jgi:putative acetyltransferase